VRIVFHKEAMGFAGGLVAHKRLLLCIVLLPSLVAISESAQSTDSSYRPAGEISQERRSHDILNGRVEPNEPESVDVGPVEPPALDRVLRRSSFDIGPELYSFKYKEPGFMEEEGLFYAVRLGYTGRNWVPSAPGESLPGGGMMFRAEARIAYGQVDYDGSVQDLQTGDTSPLTVDNIDDFAFEGRLLLGADRLRGEILNTLFTGIGYRYLYDDLSTHPAGYRRESNYLYVPLGYRFDGDRQVGWSFGFGAEYDVFIMGNQRSHFSDVGLTDMDNRQDSGYGYRASVSLKYKNNDAIVVIEPFFRYWDIDKSETERAFWGSAYEPANETTEYGIQFIWMF